LSIVFYPVPCCARWHLVVVTATTARFEQVLHCDAIQEGI
jgi:hypothetical protein